MFNREHGRTSEWRCGDNAQPTVYCCNYVQLMRAKAKTVRFSMQKARTRFPVDTQRMYGFASSVLRISIIVNRMTHPTRFVTVDFRDAINFTLNKFDELELRCGECTAARHIVLRFGHISILFVLICVTCSIGAMQVNCENLCNYNWSPSFQSRSKSYTIYFFQQIQHLKMSNANCRFTLIDKMEIWIEAMERTVSIVVDIFYFVLLLSYDSDFVCHPDSEFVDFVTIAARLLHTQVLWMREERNFVPEKCYLQKADKW